MSGLVAMLLDGSSVLLPEGFPVAEHPRDQPVEDGPQLLKVVLHRRPGKRNSGARIDPADILRDCGRRILCVLRLVEQGEFVIVFEQFLVVPVDERIRRDREVAIRNLGKALLSVGSVKNQQFEIRRKLACFPLPVADQAGRNDGEARAVGPDLQVAVRQQGKGLECLAQSHVIRKDPAEPAVGQCPEPPVACLLIGSKCPGYGLGGIGNRVFDELAQSIAKLAQLATHVPCDSATLQSFGDGHGASDFRRVKPEQSMCLEQGLGNRCHDIRPEPGNASVGKRRKELVSANRFADVVLVHQVAEFVDRDAIDEADQIRGDIQALALDLDL